ncbi:MAG: transcription-repair coupling factor [Gammaproteobacteria bacterium]|nr:transcription-repair coupling factor [Gammaproteobacteria bacterium]
MTQNTNNLLQIALPENNKPIGLARLYGSAASLSIAEMSARHNGPVVVITNDMHSSYVLGDEVSFYIDNAKQRLMYFPDWETLPYDTFSPHQDIISDRLRALYHLDELDHQQILILPVSTLLQRLTPKSYIDKHVLIIKNKQKLESTSFRTLLESSGYNCVSQVMEHGEFAVRGSIIDLFPAGSKQPFRIDLFDDEVDSIRYFDIESQRSSDAVDQIEVLPAREYPLDESAIKLFRTQYRERFEGDPSASSIYTDVSQAISPAGIEYYLSLFYEKLVTIFDYLPKNSLFIYPDNIKQEAESFWHSLDERYEQRRHDTSRPVLSPQEIYIEYDDLISRISNYQRISLSQYESAGSSDLTTNLAVSAPTQLLVQSQTDDPYKTLINYLKTNTGRTLLVAESTGRRETLLELLRSHHVSANHVNNWSDFLSKDEARLCITVGSLSQGLSLADHHITVITEPQIFGERVQQKRLRRRQKRDADAVINNLTELNIGSPVVHIDHGVGRFLGLQTLTIDDIEHEFLTIEYASNDKLYVPVSCLQLISRYTGGDADTAPLHRLGSETWQKAKRKAAEQVNDIAIEILDIHARRAAKKGLSFNIQTDEYNLFSSSFPFEETPDQQQAIDDVIADMGSSKPMDRVICGDVGFGKTEVAMRAAFIAANSGKQVVMLVPTTLLAQQHFQNFKDRFSDWPFVIESLSRFRSKKQQDEVLQGLNDGKVDILIGTHKVLSDNVNFKQLGLAIIDEEHRFGVRHKEKLKSLRAEIDILTLTATPIPRTLNMSLSGLRDLSIIATAPTQRHAIKTFVTEWNSVLIKEAIQREIKRGGQVYILHNDVKTIEKFTHDIAQLIPEARAEYAHGQMREKELEQVMLAFYHHRFNILVATTIIESGIDIPSANTIIINRADKLGLAQLHQLRGRVGRSHHRAYAYLITPDMKSISKDAVKRLNAIESMEELGIGFTLATHDLEIRGAGELLGDGQSGQIHEIGFTLYSELLERAVKALKSGKHPNLDKPYHTGAEIELGLPALIPEKYIPDVQHRLIQYKRISNARDAQELKDLRVELIDRYGLLPEQLVNLFTVVELKLAIADIGIRKIDIHNEGARIVFDEEPNIDPAKLIQLIQSTNKYKFNGKDTLYISCAMTDHVQRKEVIQSTLLSLKDKII